MKKQNVITIATFAILTFFLIVIMGSCNKNVTTPPNPNEEELITSVLLIFIDSAGIEPPAVVAFRDLDGAGGNPPLQWDSIKLKSSNTYQTEILLLDESKFPADSISNQVLQEAAEHLFCFTVLGPDISILRTDSDINGFEIGLQSKWHTGNTSSGEVQVVLRHQPDNKDGNCLAGSSDIDVLFQCKIQ